MKIRDVIRGLGFSQEEWNSFSPQEKIEHLVGYIRDVKADNRNLKTKINSMEITRERTITKHDRVISRLKKRNDMLKKYVRNYSKRKDKRSG